jgi:esterase
MKLVYRKYGEGPPLIILHGLYGSSDNWVTIAKALSENFTVYLPDLRNHGQSPHDITHDYDSMRDDLFELVSELKLRKFFLAGHSMGGKCAVSFALKWPERLLGLLVADISPFRKNNSLRPEYENHKAILEAMISLNLQTISTRREAEEIMAQKILSSDLRGFILKNLQRKTDGSYVWKLNVSALYNNIDKIIEAIAIEENDPVKGFPVIFIKGGDSDYLPDEDFSGILRVFPAAELIIVPLAGHWIHSDNPGEVIKSFIRLLPDSYS